MWLVAAALATPIESWTLEQDDGALRPGAGDLQWEWGTPTTGPTGGATGTRVWGTQLDGPYLNDAEGRLDLPSRSLAGVSEPMLVFAHWSDIAEGDAAWVEADFGSGYEVLDPPYGYPGAEGFTGVSGGWQTAFFSLEGLTDTSRVRLVFSADASVQGAGWYIDDLELWDGDVVPPRVAVLAAPADTDDLLGPYPVEAAIEDDHTVAEALVHWQTADDVGAEPLSVVGGVWSGGVPAQPADTEVTWWISASDGLNTVETDAESFRVRLPAPTDLTGPEGRVVDTQAELVWVEPVSRHAVASYVVERAGVEVGEVDEPLATVDLEGDGLDVFQVRARYDVGLGDASDPVTLDVLLPRVVGLDPDAGFQGDQLTVQLEGEWLLLLDGDVDVGLGEGVQVPEVDVLDVDRLELQVVVDEDASEGPRDLLLRSGEVVVSLQDAFEVLDGQGRPALTGVTPDSVRQGDVVTVVIESTAGFASEALLLDVGEGVLVEDVRVNGATVEADLVVAPSAPLGLRPVTLDDGERLFEGVELRVRDALPTDPGTCSVVDRRGLGVLAVLAGLLFVRRR